MSVSVLVRWERFSVVFRCESDVAFDVWRQVQAIKISAKRKKQLKSEIVGMFDDEVLIDAIRDGVESGEQPAIKVLADFLAIVSYSIDHQKSFGEIVWDCE